MEESLTMFEFNFVKKVQFCQKVKKSVLSEITQEDRTISMN